MKAFTIVIRILFVLVLLLPILGFLGVFPPPTAQMYSPQGWAFMQALMATGYMTPLITLLAAVCLVLVVMNKTALAAVLLAPFTVNVVLFHIMDSSLLSPAAIPAWVLFLCNAYFLWLNRAKYRTLW